MATTEYMESQTYSATIGGVVYNVTANLGTLPGQLGWYNVKSYGAVGDGVTDDTTAINEAIAACDAAGGGTVLFPYGTYMIDATVGLTCGSNMTLDLSSMPSIKAITNSAASYVVLKINQQENVTIRGGNFFGERDTHGGAAIEQGHVIMVQGSDNVRLYGVNSSDAMGDNLYIGVAATTDYSTNVLVDGCTFDNAYRNNCSITDAYDVTLTGCTFIGADGTAPKGGLDIEPNPARVVKNVSVVGCRFVNNVGSGLQLIGTKAGATLTDISVTGCSFTGNGSSTTAHGAIKIDSATNVSIVGNLVEDSDNNGIYVQSLTASSITGNVMRNLQLNGMYFDTAIGCAIGGNTINQASLAADNTSDGIYIRDSDRVVVSGNMVSVGASGNNQRYGFFADATATNDKIQVYGNVFEGVTKPFLHAGTATSSSISSGAGSPESSVRTQVGSVYMRTDGGASSTLYVKESGTGTTGWVAHGPTAWTGHDELSDVAYDDIVVSPASLRLPAVGAPTAITWKSDLEVPGFDASGGEYAYFAVQLPHNYVPGTDLHWHVHFTNDTTIADGQTVVFRFRFTSGPINGAMTALGNADATFTNNAAARTAITAVAPAQISGTGILADTHMIAGGATITGTTFGLSTVLYGRIERLSSDTYTGEALLLSADAHIQKNRLGSENEYTG